VTGANGYIGAATARALRAVGYTVYGLIRNAKHQSELVKEEIVPVVGSVDTVSVEPYAVIVDTATGISAEDGKASLGLLGKITRFNAANPTYKKTYIYTSGALIYGDHPNEVLSEDMPPKNRVFGWRVDVEREIIAADQVVLRPGGVYGGSGGGIAMMFFKSPYADPTADIVIRGKPDKMLSMVHIQDLAAAYVAVVAASRSTVAGQIFDISDDTRVPYAQLAESLARVAGSTGKLVYVPDSSFFDATAVQSAQKIRRVLGWHPTHGAFGDDYPLYFEAWKAHQSPTMAAPEGKAPTAATEAAAKAK